ncbi:50S ribosomal protein L4 [Helicobacter muridarum]|uniref:Large ribosomal subunit protein uL4 n=1 Tax=Helicobacter muridarum TaxID=216 RepID=A0A099U282_9HELI|nr:50S ribosomal protein L4 [Helicobacter muridarum]TLE01418.1 50S ribosomal protein L4 [Helicobacter muridarum]STQ85347.1 50S ribosomal protein L4 [Helicobacter muridarum]
MSQAILLNDGLTQSGVSELPERYNGIKEHNLYLYVKSYLASVRSNNAQAKNRSMVSGGGKKPWAQKGGGRARAGSITSPVFVGGGVSHGPNNTKNYFIKINKKQKKLALEFALKQKADSNSLFVVDSISVPSGKTREAYAKFKAFNKKNMLFVAQKSDERTFLAFRNIQECYLIDADELNAYLIAAFRSVMIEKAVFDEIIKRG